MKKMKKWKNEKMKKWKNEKMKKWKMKKRKKRKIEKEKKKRKERKPSIVVVLHVSKGDPNISYLFHETFLK